MKIFDRQTCNEIQSRTSRVSGSDHVRDQLVRHGSIKNIIFGSSARGTIADIAYKSQTVFENCKFNYVTFQRLANCAFINCEFYKCEFYNSDDLKFDSCFTLADHVDLHNVTGAIEFYNCPNLSVFFYGCYYGNMVKRPQIVSDGSCKAVEEYLDKIKEQLEKEEEARILNDKIRAGLAYGYKVVSANVLVKLSFPQDAELVNLDKRKSRASKAFVESVRIINDFKGEGVTNMCYAPLDYKVGEVVVPDNFDPNPNQDCGHGIHFCKEIKDLPNYTTISYKQAEYLKSIEDQL